jgi:iron(III) transport system substrate-binding protein
VSQALAWHVMVGLLTVLMAASGHAVEVTRFPALAPEQGILRVHAATDLAAMEPLIRDFQVISPHVSIEYVEYQTVDLYAQAQADCRAKRGSMDVVLSSSVDQLVKLVNDGCARAIRSPSAARLPAWTRWRNEIFGFTFEPAVIVYNPDLVPPEDVRHTRAELIDLLRAKPERYSGRIGAYDIEQSGIGYLFAIYDSRGTTVYGRLLEALARTRVATACCTADLLSALSAGRLAIGYNLLGSYAVGAVRRGAQLRIVVPRDFTVVLSRAAFVPAHAGSPIEAASFVEYLLSPRGQLKAQEASFFFSFDGPLPEEVDGPSTLTSSTLLRPIEISPELLAVQDRAKRERFLREWRRSMQVEAGVR